MARKVLVQTNNKHKTSDVGLHLAHSRRRQRHGEGAVEGAGLDAPAAAALVERRLRPRANSTNCSAQAGPVSDGPIEAVRAGSEGANNRVGVAQAGMRGCAYVCEQSFKLKASWSRARRGHLRQGRRHRGRDAELALLFGGLELCHLAVARLEDALERLGRV